MPISGEGPALRLAFSFRRRQHITLPCPASSLPAPAVHVWARATCPASFPPPFPPPRRVSSLRPPGLREPKCVPEGPRRVKRASGRCRSTGGPCPGGSHHRRASMSSRRGPLPRRGQQPSSPLRGGCPRHPCLPCLVAERRPAARSSCASRSSGGDAGSVRDDGDDGGGGPASAWPSPGTV